MSTESIAEELVFFSFSDESLAGVLTVPSKPNGHTALLAWGAGAFPSSGRNRIRTRLARALAADGYHSFRFDYAGVGESSGEYRPAHLSSPYSDQIVAAAEWLVSRGLGRIVLVGNCFGAWSSLMATPSVPGLEGLAIAGSPVRRDHKDSVAANTTWSWWWRKLRGFQLRKFFNPERRARYLGLVRGKASAMLGSASRDNRFVDAIKALVDRSVPVLIIHSENSFGADLVAELARGLDTILDSATYPTRVLGISDTVGGSFATQSALIEAVQAWIADLHSVMASPSPTPDGRGYDPAREDR
ncbi:MAG: alpha/beta hydrolase [Actinobacteria bacterium]|nr:alpha/beta hydrolase [Actinomycetota bacterium]